MSLVDKTLLTQRFDVFRSPVGIEISGRCTNHIALCSDSRRDQIAVGLLAKPDGHVLALFGGHRQFFGEIEVHAKQGVVLEKPLQARDDVTTPERRQATDFQRAPNLISL